MGGDFAPEAAVKGAVMAAGELDKESHIVLFGDEEQIKAILAAENCDSDKIEIVHTTEVIEMGDHPAKAFQQKANSSITVGFGYLAKGLIHGFSSAGSTGSDDGWLDVRCKAYCGSYPPHYLDSCSKHQGRASDVVGRRSEC